MTGRSRLRQRRPGGVPVYPSQSRRDFLRRCLGLGAVFGLGSLAEIRAALAAGPEPEGVLLGELPFQAEPEIAAHTKRWAGLDARRATDLSRVAPDRLVTPTGEFYVRTERPDGWPAARPWRIRVGGLAGRPLELSPADLEPLAAPMGTHLMECAGNDRRFRFGLMSAAEWTGVPIARLLARAAPRPRATSVEVAGFDEHSATSQSSTAGCSWIFTREQLESAGAFLATGMNGRPLTPDHGHPARLVVPGWYGCCDVKWVERIELMAGDRPATSQMREFALRTHQGGVPERAADYRPAIVPRAALPIRVEKWRAGGEIRYRVVGIDWGGDRATGSLRIRFRPTEPYLPVATQPSPAGATTWALWFHTWSPSVPGRYLIQLEVDDPSAPTPRLDAGHYARGVEVDEVS